MLNIGGPDAKARLGGNATAAVSAAVLKAGANALGVPLYQHIGGVNACILPVPGAGALNRADRYGGGQRAGDKPSHEFVCYGFDTFAEASYAGWELEVAWAAHVAKKYGVRRNLRAQVFLTPGQLKDDRQIWGEMAETIAKCGYAGKVGLQVDVAAACFWEKDKGRYVGLFSAEDRTKDDLFRWYEMMVKEFPFVILEDPLDEDDYESHAELTKLLGVQITGDDLFTTTTSRVAEAAKIGAANTVLLKVNQVGTISEAFDMVRFAHMHKYDVQPCSSRGEGDAIADYTVGLICGTVRGCATGSTANRFLQIERELGRRARFAGKAGLQGWRFQQD